MKRLPLSKVEYQFQNEEHHFETKCHGNDKKGISSYMRTQKSTLNALRMEVEQKKPRVALDSVSERFGGITGGSSSASLPRNISQAYNSIKQVTTKFNKSQESGSIDGYMSLILTCKDQMKDPKTAYIQKVLLAPEPMVVLANEQQLDDVVKFCTNPIKFCVFQADPTFDLGNFSVTTTQYEHLLLLDRRSGKPPAMVGPLLIHQRKGKESYKVLTEFIAEKRNAFRKLCSYGTDGEENLVAAFRETAPSSCHLRCFLHFKNNLKEKMKKIGMDEANRKLVCADIFGQQVGSVFEEGAVDSDDEEEFYVRLESLKNAWIQRIGEKGENIYKWFMKYKAKHMAENMLKPVRIKAGLGTPPTTFVTNRVECINALLKLETNRKSLDISHFADRAKELVERQQRNVRWAIVGMNIYYVQGKHQNLF